MKGLEVLKGLVATLALILVGAADEPVKTPEPPNIADRGALLEAHNRERKAAKLPTFAINPKLEVAALAHARDMARREKMTHEGSDGSNAAQRIERQSYHFRSAAENVAAGQSDVDEVMKSWLESPPHKENILGPCTEIGAACVKSEDGTPYWCVDFGLPWPVLDPKTVGADLIVELNRARTEAKLSALKAHPKLSAAAMEQAKASAASAPEDPKAKVGDSPFQRVTDAGYRFRSIAEAVASGQPTPKEVARTWLEDPKTRELILGEFWEVGLGYATNDKGLPEWCLILAKPFRRSAP
ncbi:CAP domain-containing protein [Singulisphaera rosea]